MTEEPEQTTVIAPPKKRTGWPKGKPRPRKIKQVAPPTPNNELFGLDAYKCCDGCNVDRCVITEAPFCGHPFKSPLQPMFMLNPKVVSRYNKAKAYLSGQSIDPGRL